MITRNQQLRADYGEPEDSQGTAKRPSFRAPLGQINSNVEREFGSAKPAENAVRSAANNESTTTEGQRSPWRSYIAAAYKKVGILDEARTPPKINLDEEEERSPDELALRRNGDEQEEPSPPPPSCSPPYSPSELEIARDTMSAMEAAAAAVAGERVEERERLEATVRAIGEQLVSAHRERDAATVAAAREAAQAAQGRMAHAASFDALHQECLGKLAKARNEAREARDDLISKAQRQFAQARDQYAAVCADLGSKRGALTDAKKELVRLAEALEASESQATALKQDLARKANENADLASKLEQSKAGNATLKAEVAELRKISEELANIAEQGAPTEQTSDTVSTSSARRRTTLNPSYLETPAAVRSLRL